MADELKRKEKEDNVREYLDKEIVKNDPNDPHTMELDPLGPTSEKITGGHIPFVELGLTPFTLLKQHTVDRFNMIIFENQEILSWGGLKKDWSTQVDVVTVTENIIMEGTDNDPIFIASINIEDS